MLVFGLMCLSLVLLEHIAIAHMEVAYARTTRTLYPRASTLLLMRIATLTIKLTVMEVNNNLKL